MKEEELLKMLLDRGIDLISRDMSEIHKQAENGKLPNDSAQALVRYVNLLHDMSELQKKDKGNQKKKLNTMSTDDLIKEYMKMQNKDKLEE